MAENELIKASVSLDIENKQVVIDLPVKTEPSQVLAENNIKIAERVLNQQCKKYFKDKDAQEMIKKNQLKASCAGQLEVIFEKAGDHIKEKEPEMLHVADLLVNHRFVDDLENNFMTEEDNRKLSADTEQFLKKLGMSVKE